MTMLWCCTRLCLDCPLLTALAAAAAALIAMCLLQDVPASRKTKIVCTMGPSCTSAELLSKLVAAGMDLAHFDLTTGALEEQQAAYATLQQVGFEQVPPPDEATQSSHASTKQCSHMTDQPARNNDCQHGIQFACCKPHTPLHAPAHAGVRDQRQHCGHCCHSGCW